MTLRFPKLSLVLLIGPYRSEKSTFAHKHFEPTWAASTALPA